MRLPLFMATVAAVSFAAAAPAFALCTICNASVRLDSGLATCFAERAGDELKKLTESGKSFVIVDLSDCDSRGGLPTGTAAAALPVDKQFVADEAGIKCLNEAIAALEDSAWTPSHLFDLTKDCPA